MLAALALPRLLERRPDWYVMLPAAVPLGLVLLAFAGVLLGAVGPAGRGFANGEPVWAWPALLGTWALLGVGYSAVQTPTRRLLKRSSATADRPALFAAQFALSHAAWLIA